MTPARWARVSDIVGEALERPVAVRGPYVATACAGDLTLQAEVESLIAAAVDPGDSGLFLERPLVNLRGHTGVPVAPAAAVGERIGRYRVLASIGRGGMGEVFLAEDLRLGRRVALKLLPSHSGQDADRVRRFAREARAASALSHPNVCVVHEIGETPNGHPFFAMEYVEGPSLRTLLDEASQAGSRLPLRRVLDIAAQAAAGVAAAHAAGVIHRDLKPENLLVTHDGLVKVVDFGIAGRLGDVDTSTTPALTAEHVLVRPALNGSVQLTAPGFVLGTIPYMSPEQLCGERLDGRTDVWSLGVVLYEMLTGISPFAAVSASERVRAVLERVSTPLHVLAPGMPEQLGVFVDKMLAKSRNDRPMSMRAVWEQLDAWRLEQLVGVPRSGWSAPAHTSPPGAAAPTLDRHGIGSEPEAAPPSRGEESWWRSALRVRQSPPPAASVGQWPSDGTVTRWHRVGRRFSAALGALAFVGVSLVIGVSTGVVSVHGALPAIMGSWFGRLPRSIPEQWDRDYARRRLARAFGSGRGEPGVALLRTPINVAGGPALDPLGPRIVEAMRVGLAPVFAGLVAQPRVEAAERASRVRPANTPRASLVLEQAGAALSIQSIYYLSNDTLLNINVTFARVVEARRIDPRTRSIRDDRPLLDISFRRRATATESIEIQTVSGPLRDADRVIAKAVDVARLAASQMLTCEQAPQARIGGMRGGIPWCWYSPTDIRMVPMRGPLNTSPAP